MADSGALADSVRNSREATLGIICNSHQVVANAQGLIDTKATKEYSWAPFSCMALWGKIQWGQISSQQCQFKSGYIQKNLRATIHFDSKNDGYFQVLIPSLPSPAYYLLKWLWIHIWYRIQRTGMEALVLCLSRSYFYMKTVWALDNCRIRIYSHQPLVTWYFRIAFLLSAKIFAAIPWLNAS